MKRQIIAPAVKRNTVQALVDYLVDNGMSEMGANQFLHVNIPALGGNRSIMDCIVSKEWDTAWGVAESYMAGDYF